MGFFNSSNSNIQRYSQDQDRSFKYNEIKRWVEVHGGAIIKDHYATEDELEEDWYKYKSLPSLWYRANDEAMRLFGKDNEALYYENKQRFMKTNSVYGLESEFGGIKDVDNSVLDKIKAKFRYTEEPGIELEKEYYPIEEKKKRDGILIAPNLSSKDLHIERVYSPVLKEDGSDISDEEKLKQVKNYTDNDYPILRKEYDNLNDLENDWFKYNSNDRDRRKNCDDFSMSIYGKTVTDIYNDNLKRLLNQEDISDNVMPMEYKPTSVDEEQSNSLLYEEALFRTVSETDDYAYLANMKYRLLEDDRLSPVKYIYRGKILDRINYKLDYDVSAFLKLGSTSRDIPILTPDEIARFGNSENTTYAPSDFAIKWFNNYNGIMNGIKLSFNPVSWVTEVTTLSYAYQVEQDPEEKERLAANLMFLGWNPRFSYNTYYRRVANERINKYLSDRSVCNYIPIYNMPVFKHDAFIESTELKEECPAVYFIFHDDLKVGEPGFFVSFDGFKNNIGYLNIFNNIGSEYSSYKDKENITKYFKNDDFIMAFAVPLLVEDFDKVKANFESYLMNTSLNNSKTLKEGTEAKALIDIYPRRIMSDFMKLFLDSSFDFNTSLDLDDVMKYLEDTKGKEFDAYIVANTVMVNFNLQNSMKATKLNFNDLKSISIKENYTFTEDNIDCYPYLCLSEYGRIKNTKSKPKKDKKILKEFFDLLNNKIIDI